MKDELKNVALIIIDEVSMISNIMLMYKNNNLTEIFETSNCENGYFGKKHILLFGDLLQLPPVRKLSCFIPLTFEQLNKYVGSMGSLNLWHLFYYEKLTINIRQKGDKSYRQMLSRIRLGKLVETDIQTLNSQKMNFISTTCTEKLKELCSYMYSLPSNTVCLLPTCHLCDTLNAAMLQNIQSVEIQLIAEDSVQCSEYLKKKLRMH